MDDLRQQLEHAAASVGAPDVKGRKMPYLAINGNMFAFVAPELGLCLRFDEDRRAELADRFGTGPVLQYGSEMKGYVALPAEQLGNLQHLLAESLTHARGLKPKPTKR